MGEPRDLFATAAAGSFCLFAASIPLEYPARTIPLEVHTITGSMCLLVALTRPGLCFRRPPVAFWWFAAYLWLFAMAGLLAEHTQEAAKWFFNYFLVAMLFWVGANLMTRTRVARSALLAFAAGCSVVALLSFLNVGTALVGTGDTARRVVLAQDANLLGANMALGLVILLSFAATSRWGWSAWPLALGSAGLMGYCLLQSGSRGATLALALGLAASACRFGFRAMARGTVVAVLATAVLFAAVSCSETMRQRYLQSFEQGKLAGREQIYPEAWQMFLEKPVFGWGPIDNNYELGWRTVSYHIGNRAAAGLAPSPMKDFHNLLLDAVTSVGAVGTFPLVICVGLSLMTAWRGRSGPAGTLPLALTSIILAVNMSLSWGAAKQTWLVFAYGVGASRHASRHRVHHVRARVILQPYGHATQPGR
jgi:O-antigen ligase